MLSQRRFKSVNDGESTDEQRLSALCAILSLARDGRTQLQVQIWLDSADVLATSGVRSRPEVLGEAAKSETGGFCQEDPVTSGNPITRTTCYTTTLDGSIAGAAVVHGSSAVAVRIDAKPNGQTKDEFQRFLQEQASSVADAVVAAI